MINLRTNAAKRREAAIQVRLSATIEKSAGIRLRGEFNHVASMAAAAMRAKKNPVSDMIMEQHRQSLTRILGACWSLAIRANARRVYNFVGKSLVRSLEKKATEEEIDGIVQDYTDEFTAVKVKQVTDTTKAHITNAVQKGLKDGKGVSEIAQDIEDRAGGVIGASRALIIARTETHAAAQTGSVRAADSLGIPGLLKEWVAVDDARTRPDHVAANGLAVPMSDTFRVGDADLDFPGDPSADAPEQTINCRCATVFQSPEE